MPMQLSGSYPHPIPKPPGLAGCEGRGERLCFRVSKHSRSPVELRLFLAAHGRPGNRSWLLEEGWEMRGSVYVYRVLPRRGGSMGYS